MVDKLAHLAKLSFTEQEKEEVREDLEKLIAFVDQLRSLDLEGVPPLMHMSDVVNVWREDAVGGSIDRSEGLRNAPDSNGPFFTVPKVIKK
jgi:aspartyl-tRNA(Asn)/glutamyl-tRNA(Gln) amidotransferase subunit C